MKWNVHSIVFPTISITGSIYGLGSGDVARHTLKEEFSLPD
jgi:hypothetical protein